MKLTYKIFTIIGLILTIASCGLFSPRDPESPDTGKSSYVPPTSPDIVITNFIASLKEKNTENYIACFTMKVTSDSKEFVFIPSNEASSLYPQVFDSWGIINERQYFVSMITKLLNEFSPDLQLSNSRFDVITPDSAIYISDYYLYVNHNITTYTNKAQGTLQFSLIHRSDGLWSINQWYDFKPAVDTLKITWSVLKAQFIN